MAKPKSIFVCRECGAEALRWQGQCPGCEQWNTLDESAAAPAVAAPAGRGGRGYAGENRVRMLDEIDESGPPRYSSGFAELDRVLGGGIVPGGVVLLGGDPGIGKSTLLLQMVMRLQQGKSIIYVSGEESLNQIRLRAQRLGGEGMPLGVLAETEVESIIAELDRGAPDLLIIDSIQTLYSQAISSAPGAVAQLRECCAQLVRYAKQKGVAVFLVGHVTKDGVIAGPRVLEHMVDTVLYFEADPGGRLRLIRAAKNRFGAVNELGFFAMADEGLKEVRNPSAIFLSRGRDAVAGAAVLASRESTRSLLVEVQALVDQAAGGSPRRVSVGLDGPRLAMLIAILHRHAGIALGDQDVYVNVVGGLQIRETAADLAVVLAALSSFRDRALPAGLVVFGELGLSGEIRPVSGGEERISEAAKQGFMRAIVPAGNRMRKPPGGMQIDAVGSLSEALDLLD